MRDEFDFRCGYCLHREKWDHQSDFEIDHWSPKAGRNDYSNLVFSCRSCNGQKTDHPISLKPLRHDLALHLVFSDSGVAVDITPEGLELIRKLSLNSPDRVALRQLWLEVWAETKDSKPEQVMGWPGQLPDLTKARSIANRVNTDQCYFKQNERGELPKTFVSYRPNHVY